jgi:hypothetical protein
MIDTNKQVFQFSFQILLIDPEKYHIYTPERTRALTNMKSNSSELS